VISLSKKTVEISPEFPAVKLTVDFVLWLEIVLHNGLDTHTHTNTVVYDLRPADYTTTTTRPTYIADLFNSFCEEVYVVAFVSR